MTTTPSPPPPSSSTPTRNGHAAPIPEALTIDTFRSEVLARASRGERLVALFGEGHVPEVESPLGPRTPEPVGPPEAPEVELPPGPRTPEAGGPSAAPGVQLWAVLADDRAGELTILRAQCDGGSYPALTPEWTEAHLFERELWERTGLVPDGHPWLKPVRYNRPGDVVGVPDAAAPSAGFYRVEGDAVHEVGVGPVHAGVIEPGHFRFQCHGEEVFHLEIALGYQHRGVEAGVLARPRHALRLVEVAAGDTTVAHALAYCEAIEGLAGARVPARALALRAVALELERLANHVGDLGALAGDVAFLPTASYCGRIRGELLNLTAALCGNRFGRSFVVPGGVGFDVLDAASLAARLEVIARDTAGAVGLLWVTPAVRSRFEETGVVSVEAARELGLVGPAARASGVDRDVRRDHPSGMYRLVQLPVAVVTTGDVQARASVRWLECVRSFELVREQLAALPEGPVRAEVGPLRPDRVVATLAEGWRGEVAHVAVTGSSGTLRLYRLVDPSFHNWQGLALALRGEGISDFPLCNKSFNLSYCGHDL